MHAHWNELLLETRAVLAESTRPLRRGEDRSEIVGRKDGNSSVASLHRAVHVQNEVVAWPKIPGLNDDAVFADLLKLLRDPLRPLAVSLVVADEEVLLLWGVALGHVASES